MFFLDSFSSDVKKISSKKTARFLLTIDQGFRFCNETLKVSRDCYVSWNGNRYSVPWIYAGREALVTEESTLRIQVGSHVIAEHEILHGTGRISRNKVHFDGLLRTIRDDNVSRFETMVEKRDLSQYEVS